MKESIDLCLNITGPEYLSSLEKNTTQDFVSLLVREQKSVSFLLDFLRFNRIYMGAEFCWKLLPPCTSC